MSFLDEIKLLDKVDLAEALQKVDQSKIGEFLARHNMDHHDPDRSKLIQSWGSWCKNQTKRVRCVEADVPNDILPRHFKGVLTDIKVGGQKRTPDDALYNRHEDLRNRVARGNTILYLSDLENKTVHHDAMIFALKKFTGGMGDEDEDQPENNKVWMDYFLRPVSATEKVVCTIKANGEAAHFSVRYIHDRFVLCVGSKNVHMLVRSKEDVEKYRDSRYLVAKTVAMSVLEMLLKLEEHKCSLLLSFMSHTHLTAVFEVLQPHYQHVVDLSHLQQSELHFITWTAPYGVVNDESHCAMSPDLALDFAQFLGMKCVDYETICADEAENRMEQVREGYNYEGEVLYFVDKKGNVIGLLKKKSTWYVVLRAIREKVSAALLDYKKTPSGYSHSSRAKKLSTRLVQIQNWLGFSDVQREQWEKLGIGFLKWLISQSATNNLGDVNVRGNFPKLWNRFLKEENLSDKV